MFAGTYNPGASDNPYTAWPDHVKVYHVPITKPVGRHGRGITCPGRPEQCRSEQVRLVDGDAEDRCEHAGFMFSARMHWIQAILREPRAINDRLFSAR